MDEQQHQESTTSQSASAPTSAPVDTPVAPPPTSPPVSPAPVHAEVMPEPKPSQYEPPHEEHAKPIDLPTSTSQPKPPVPHRAGGCGKMLMDIGLFAVLFALGVGLSSLLRDVLPNGLPKIPVPKVAQPSQLSPSPATPQPTQVQAAADAFANWKTYPVINGITRQSVSGVQYRLPPDIAQPLCDGTNCASQGTNLPGGTRFTVAARGVGQVLADYRGKRIVDVLGSAFTSKETTIAGKTAVEFNGTFTGTTVTGYGFSSMRGVMIEVSPTLSLEVNHFTPAGTTADFEKDGVLFDEILRALLFGEGSTSQEPKGGTAGCGGPTQQSCPSGFYCRLDSAASDASGSCVKI